MGTITKIIVLFFLIIQASKADGIVPIKKGEVSTIDGFVITKEFEKDLRQTNEENKLLKRQNLVLKDLQVTQEDLVSLHKENARNAQKELEKEQIKGFFKSTLYFVGGVILGGAISYGLSKVYK